MGFPLRTLAGSLVLATSLALGCSAGTPDEAAPPSATPDPAEPVGAVERPHERPAPAPASRGPSVPDPDHLERSRGGETEQSP